MYKLFNPLLTSFDGNPFRLLTNYFLFCCIDTAVFTFPTLLVDFKDLLHNWDRVPAIWTEINKAKDLSIMEGGDSVLFITPVPTVL